MNHTTKKFHRDMNSAFGPYCNRHIDEPVRPYDWEDLTILWGCMAAVVAIVLLGYLT